MSDHTPPVSPVESTFLGKLTATLRQLASRLPILNALFARWLCVAECDGETYEVDGEAIGETARKLRGRDEYALRTHLLNQGISSVAIYEDGNLMELLTSGQARLLRAAGLGEISAAIQPYALLATGLVAAVVDATHFRITNFTFAQPFPEAGDYMTINGTESRIVSAEIAGGFEGIETNGVNIVLETAGAPTVDAPSYIRPRPCEIKVTTVRRCICGVTGYVDDERPIGSDLL